MNVIMTVRPRCVFASLYQLCYQRVSLRLVIPSTFTFTLTFTFTFTGIPDIYSRKACSQALYHFFTWSHERPSRQRRGSVDYFCPAGVDADADADADTEFEAEAVKSQSQGKR